MPNQCDCGNPGQCFEPCGALGHDEAYARPTDTELDSLLRMRNSAIMDAVAKAGAYADACEKGGSLARENAKAVTRILRGLLRGPF